METGRMRGQQMNDNYEEEEEEETEEETDCKHTRTHASLRRAGLVSSRLVRPLALFDCGETSRYLRFVLSLPLLPRQAGRENEVLKL